MKNIYPIISVLQKYLSQDILVNSIGSSSLNQSYRDVNRPIHVEPAAKIYLSPEAIELLRQNGS